MIPYVSEDRDPAAVPIWPVAAADYERWRDGRPEAERHWLERYRFRAQAGQACVIPGGDGRLAGVALGLGERPELWSWGGLAAQLPTGTYRVDDALDRAAADGAALAWALGTYAFTRYRVGEQGYATLELPAGADAAAVARAVEATFLVRDLVNTPAGDMGPEELAAAAGELANRHGGQCEVTVGEDLLGANYPAIHAVGRASARAPRLIDLSWGDQAAPRVTLVGKGVCFDSGGLDLKPAAAMLKMKKDMGGAATVLGLAHMVMAAGLPVRLRVLIPAVENAVSGNAFRPGDVLSTRKGLSVEIGNTDAEGRIVLCDALAEADSEAPALLIDCATLTGSARVALGPDLPALFTDDEALAGDLARSGAEQQDPLWRLPLHPPYAEWLKSKVADLNNVAEGPFAGAVIAALFLKSFVSPGRAWAHLDLYAWNDKPRPGRPAGGEAMAMRALCALIAERFGR